jgi:transcriptional regulator with XRE-family HTH domain
MTWKEQLGNEIRLARKRRGMTREELLEALHTRGFSISMTSIGNYERGERAPDFEDLRQIAAALEEDYFEVRDNFRVQFGLNGNARPEPLAQQLELDFDEDGGVTVRIESTGQGQGVIIKRMSA